MQEKICMGLYSISLMSAIIMVYFIRKKEIEENENN